MSRTATMTSTAVASAFQREAVDDFVDLLELTVPGADEPLRFVNQAVERLKDASGWELEDQYGTPVYGCVHQGEQYFYLPFSMPWPTSEGGQAPRSSLEVTNLTRELMPYIRRIEGRAKVRIVTVHTSDMDRIQAEFTGLEIGNFEYDEDTISAELGMDMLTNTAYPAHSYTPDWVPGAF